MQGKRLRYPRFINTADEWAAVFSYCRCVFAMLPARFCGGRVAFSSSQHRGLIPPVTLPQILYDITCCRSSGP